MNRGFVSGLAAGLVVASVAVVTVSQWVPLAPSGPGNALDTVSQPEMQGPEVDGAMLAIVEPDPEDAPVSTRLPSPGLPDPAAQPDSTPEAVAGPLPEVAPSPEAPTGPPTGPEVAAADPVQPKASAAEEPASVVPRPTAPTKIAAAPPEIAPALSGADTMVSPVPRLPQPETGAAPEPGVAVPGVVALPAPPAREPGVGTGPALPGGPIGAGLAPRDAAPDVPPLPVLPFKAAAAPLPPVVAESDAPERQAAATAPVKEPAAAMPEPPADSSLPTDGKMPGVILPSTEPAGETFAPSTGLAETAPLPGFEAEVGGVVTGRLPRIGDAAPAAEPAVGGTASLPAIRRNAAAFANPQGMPLFSIVLIDTGALEPALLTDLGFPVTIAIDPTRPDAAQRALVYRAAGLEVLILATALPGGATAADLEVTFQSHFTSLPGAVGVMDLDAGGFQDDRLLAQQIVTILAGGGYGLVTYDKGLNPAGAVARRDGLPAVKVFRELDAGGENESTIRRYLDRAAFKAAQEGAVVVVGHTTPETVAALMAWAVEGRSASVTLAPVSVAMGG